MKKKKIKEPMFQLQTPLDVSSVDGYVRYMIGTWPSSYAHGSFEDCKFLIIHNVCTSLGSGEKWANTKDSSKGGYIIIDPKYYTKGKEEGERKYDKPYGKNLATEVRFDPERVLSEDMYSIGGIKTPSDEVRHVFESELTPDEKDMAYDGDAISKILDDNKGNSTITHIDPELLKKLVHSMHTEVSIRKWTNSTHTTINKLAPYPNFDKGYSLFWEPEIQYIQEDWRVACLEHLQYWLEYFNDDEKVKNHWYYKESRFPQERKKSIKFLKETISKLENLKK